MPTDNFDSGINTTTNWDNGSNGMTTLVAASGGAKMNTDDCAMRAKTTWATAANDQYSQAALANIPAVSSGYAADAGIGVAVRMASGTTKTFYQAVIVNAPGGETTTYLGKRVGGVYTQLATATTAWAASDVLRLEVSGQNPNITLLVKKNGATVITKTSETSINNGQYGIHGSYYDSEIGAYRVDNWDGGDLVTTTPITIGPLTDGLAGEVLP